MADAGGGTIVQGGWLRKNKRGTYTLYPKKRCRTRVLKLPWYIEAYISDSHHITQYWPGGRIFSVKVSTQLLSASVYRFYRRGRIREWDEDV